MQVASLQESKLCLTKGLVDARKLLDAAKAAQECRGVAKQVFKEARVKMLLAAPKAWQTSLVYLQLALDLDPLPPPTKSLNEWYEPVQGWVKANSRRIRMAVHPDSHPNCQDSACVVELSKALNQRLDAFGKDTKVYDKEKLLRSDHEILCSL